MVKFVVNARFLTQNLTGVQRFATEICLRLKEIYPELLIVAPRNIKHIDLAKSLNVKTIGKHSGYFWEQIELPLWLKRHGNPLLLNLCNMSPCLYSNNITVVHDIIYIRYPKTVTRLFYLTYMIMMPIAVKRAKHIFTVSEFSKLDISKYFKIQKNKITVACNSVNENFHPVIDKDLRNENYFLAVSSIKENKNFLMILDAFEKLPQSKTNTKLYVIGDIHTHAFNEIDISEYRQNTNIRFLGRVSDEKLIKYYSNAVAFLFPSFYEGFGIPPLEAQACGCPAICANTSCLPEIFGDSVLYCDPHNVDSLVDCMNRVCNEDVRTALIEKGHVNVSRYSWDESAKRILNIIQASEQS